MKRIYLDSLLLLAFFGAAWLLFSFFFSGTEPTTGILSEDKEEKIARHLHEQVLKEHPVLESEQWQLITDSVVQRLNKAAGLPPDTYTVHLLDEGTRNAFATLGGNIYLYKGMLELTGSPEVLAAVLAHEMAHLHHRDFEQRLSKEIGLTALLAIFSAGNAQTAAELGKTVFALGYDRQQEKQADAYASALLAKAQIHPNRLTELFLKLKRTEDDALPEAFDFLRSHPHLKYRIEQASLQAVDSDFTERPLAVAWE